MNSPNLQTKLVLLPVRKRHSHNFAKTKMSVGQVLQLIMYTSYSTIRFMIDHFFAVWNEIPLVHGSIRQLQSWIYYGFFVLVSTLCGYKPGTTSHHNARSQGGHLNYYQRKYVIIGNSYSRSVNGYVSGLLGFA